MPHLVEKTTTEELRREFEFDNEIATGDSLASATYVVKDEDGTVVTDDLIEDGSQAISGDSVLLTIIGGAHDRRYTLHIYGVTTNGFKPELDVVIRVIDY